MSFLNFNDGIIAFKADKNAVLLDVRTKEEYNAGHIDGSINLPMQSLNKISAEVENRFTPLYVYCHSGVRSAKAVKILRNKGYINVTDIGGIKDYKNTEELS